MIELWSINRWLRFTGFRLVVKVDATLGEIARFEKPTLIGFRFFGWSRAGLSVGLAARAP